MTKDFSKHQNIITNFRGKVAKSDFDAKFALSTKNLDKTEKFLLKMELNRLASACTRSIDLRGLVDGVCNLFEYNGQSHFLDEVAIRVFEENVSHYGDYTFGVYEAVKNTENNFRVIYQKEQAGNIRASTEPLNKTQDKLQYPASLYQFNHCNDRCEERMNLAVSFIVTLKNKKQLEATSTDISTTGCKFRLTNAVPLTINQVVDIKFPGLEHKFQFSSTDVFTFEVRNIYRDGNTQLVGCQRIEVPEQDAFKAFLSSYIQRNKRRYKVNLESATIALQARSFEQYILPQLTELPVFIEKVGGGLVPRYALTTTNNQAVYQYWQDESGNSILPSLLNDKRLARLKQRRDVPLLVYSFIHQSHGKYFFYSMDSDEILEETDFSNSFLLLAANQESFSITELTSVKIGKNTAYSPFALAGTKIQKEELINLPPSDEVLDSISTMPFITVITDITHPSLVAQYQQIISTKITTAKLKKYGLQRFAQPSLVHELGVSYRNQRQELRFTYDTPVIVECENITCQGDSRDFSVSGLKMELDSPAMFSKGDIVNLTFPKLQKITSTFDLKQLPYEVVHINKKKTLLNLRVHVQAHKHIGRSFFKLLINKNSHKLTSDECNVLTAGLADALRTTYAKNMDATSLVVQTSGSRYKVEAIASNTESSELFKQMKRLSDRENYYNLYPLLTKLQSGGLLEQHLKTLLNRDEPITEMLYISIDPTENRVEKSVQATLDSEFTSPDLKRFFIKKSLKHGQFYCLKLMISRTNEPDMEYLSPELNYISSYAIHRGKKLEQDIWSVVGIIQCIDVTREVLLSYNLAEL